ncbi:MAG TPA: LemA family protein [Myxococcota bacterium]|jgi:LemA protein|nr:LemA family protein [Myxococcota bacterium]
MELRSIPASRAALAAGLLCLGLAFSGCGYNTIQQADEQVKAAWAEVGNQYQRRADLVPNLVATVKGAADFEKSTLEAVVAARAKATSIQATPELVNDPEAFKKFEAAQGELSSALSRLLVTVERYPDLKANQNFRDLQAQLEGTENRITVARNRYIESVVKYNTLVRSFPTNLTARFLLGAHVRPTFEARPGAETPPEVKF